MKLAKCIRCGFVLNQCLCNHIPEKKINKIKNKIITWSIQKQIHFNLFLEKKKFQFKQLKRILKLKIRKIQIPKSNKITFSLAIEDFELLLKNCLFSNDKLSIKNLFIASELNNTNKEVKKKFQKLSIEYILEFHKLTPLPYREKLCNINQNEIPIVKIHHSNIPKKSIGGEMI
jgi:hypothetical protein